MKKLIIDECKNGYTLTLQEHVQIEGGLSSVEYSTWVFNDMLELTDHLRLKYKKDNVIKLAQPAPTSVNHNTIPDGVS